MFIFAEKQNSTTFNAGIENIELPKVKWKRWYLEFQGMGERKHLRNQIAYPLLFLLLLLLFLRCRNRINIWKMLFSNCLFSWEIIHSETEKVLFEWWFIYRLLVLVEVLFTGVNVCGIIRKLGSLLAFFWKLFIKFKKIFIRTQMTMVLVFCYFIRILLLLLWKHQKVFREVDLKYRTLFLFGSWIKVTIESHNRQFTRIRDYWRTILNSHMKITTPQLEPHFTIFYWTTQVDTY